MAGRFALALLLSLAACDDGPVGAAAKDEDDRIECAVRGGAIERVCSVETSDRQDGRVLTVRHPDGGFRRLLIATDGRGVVAADGAEQARVRISGPDRIEVSLGGDLYILPATVRRGAGS